MMLRGYVHWGAVAAGFETAIAFSFLYMIRCSLHGAALKKTVPMLSRVQKQTVDVRAVPTRGVERSSSTRTRNAAKHHRVFSEALDIEHVANVINGLHSENNDESPVETYTAKASSASLKDILLQYGYCQFVSAIGGCMAVTPCVAAAPTMFTVSLGQIQSGIA
jgi:hypothetical protein